MRRVEMKPSLNCRNKSTKFTHFCWPTVFRAWFDDNSDDVIVRHISRRVSDVTGLNTTQPAAEPLQVGSQVVR